MRVDPNENRDGKMVRERLKMISKGNESLRGNILISAQEKESEGEKTKV